MPSYMVTEPVDSRPEIVLENQIYLPNFEHLQKAFEDVKGRSRSIRQAIHLGILAAQGPSNVVIQGETGTGKELFAKCIHRASTRRSFPFIAVNCAAIPDSLLESELFGYEEGAFTGAKKGGKPGRIELAQGGTLLLDEIGEMSLYLQSKLLRVLQEKTVERLGGTRSIDVDVRFIATTNRNLESLVNAKQFREDLYYRLCVFPIYLPPLRERKEDIPLLVNHFVKQKGLLLGKPFVEVPVDVLRAFYNYHWPGNVRELENLIEYAVSITTTPFISLQSVLHRLRFRTELNPLESTGNLRQLNASQDSILIQALEKYGSTVEGKKRAARELGISLPTLYRRLRKMRGNPGQEATE